MIRLHRVRTCSIHNAWGYRDVHIIQSQLRFSVHHVDEAPAENKNQEDNYVY